jgi:hypothetical protein
LIRFFLMLAAATLILVAAAYGSLGQPWLVALPSFFFQTLILLLFGTGLIFVYLYRFDRQDLFVHIYLLSMVVKLMAYGAYNFFMVMEDEGGAVINVAWFMIVYLIFTVLEIVFLYPKVSR